MLPIEVGVEDINLGTPEKPKMVKISKSLSLEMKGKYAMLMSQFSDVFSWEYYDLKVYDKSIIQHTIPLKPYQKPFHQNLRRMNLKLLPSIHKEINRLSIAGIIVPLHFSNWMFNIVPVRKKTWYIHLCIDFINLIKVFPSSLDVPVMKIIEEIDSEPNEIHKESTKRSIYNSQEMKYSTILQSFMKKSKTFMIGRPK